MLEHLLPAKLHKITEEQRDIADHVEKSIYACIKSVKASKNIYHNIQDLHIHKQGILGDIKSTFYHNAAKFYQQVAGIIHGHTTPQDFEELSHSMLSIRDAHKHFVEHISKQLKPENFEALEVPTLINIDRYLYQGAHELFIAIHHIYLGQDEEPGLEDISPAKI